MAIALPIEIYDMLEARIGKEEARELGKAMTAAFDVIEKRADAVAVTMKAEIKAELTKELATKADLAEFKAEIKGEIKELRAETKGENKALRLELKIVFLILTAIILLTNPKALELIAKLFGLVK